MREPTTYKEMYKKILNTKEHNKNLFNYLLQTLLYLAEYIEDPFSQLQGDDIDG